ncbi:hypothetical protein [Methyloceanibacter sp.]|uniref:hypothetical protein n=1 Tax=Methyloceanibacter sp. TaxID=1965321 RepID=UPI002CDE08EE|nr:hypothetical protein [Methyloceanibacter sp.]HML93406.1 hypothetical protein [Methyloceanibacter sp.]
MGIEGEGEGQTVLTSDGGGAVLTPEEGAALVTEIESHWTEGQEVSHTPGPSGLDPKLIETWENEGGYERNLEAATRAASAVLSAVPDPESFVSGFDALPQGIQTVIYDMMRIDHAKGRGASTGRAIREMLSAQERATLKGWYDGLSEGEQDVVEAYLDGEIK